MPIAPPLIGTYTAPAVKRGEQVTCLHRDAICKVTSWTSAPIPWPRVQVIGQRGGSGLWVNDVLVKAIRTESAMALKYHFGVTDGVVWKWRKAFGVRGRAGTKGSARAVHSAALKGVAAIKAKKWTDAELAAKSATSKRLGLKPPNRWKGRGEWTTKELKLLGTDHDDAIAEKIGRTLAAVRSQRVLRKIPAFSGWPGGGPSWTAEELALLGTDTDATVAKKIGRTCSAVSQKRATLKIAAHSRPASSRGLKTANG